MFCRRSPLCKMSRDMPKMIGDLFKGDIFLLCAVVGESNAKHKGDLQ